MALKKIVVIALMVSFFVLQAEYQMPFAPYYSQEGQDKYIIEEIFNFKKNGIFFDIGAHDGISFSNTYYLEKELGWTGVCIEPQKDKFLQLLKNRSCICLEGCVFNSSGTKDFLLIHGVEQEMLSGLLETYDPRHLERAKLEAEMFGGWLEVVKIQTFEFNDICEKYKINHIDFLCIDTEGSELQIIKSIDFDSIDITVIAIENNYLDNGVKGYLEAKGYQFAHLVGGDEIFIKKL